MEKNIYDAIDEIGADEITEVLDYVLLQYKKLFPQYSVSVLSVSKHENVIYQINETIALLEKLKKTPSLLKNGIIKS